MTVLSRPQAVTHPDPSISVLRRVPVRLFVVCLMLVLSVVSWRRGVYFSGGVDPVVAAKGVVTLLTLALVVTAPNPRRELSSLPMTPILWLVAYLAVGLVGAVTSPAPLPSFVLAVRLVLTASVVVLLFRAYSCDEVLSALIAAMLVVGLLAAVTGVGTISTGRLSGGIPDLSPNEISMLLGVPLITSLWRGVSGCARGTEVALILPLLGLVWATGSRTGFAMLLACGAILVVQARRLSVPVFSSTVLLVPVAFFVLGYTSIIAGFASRGDTQSVMTLSSRTVAWRAAAHWADTPVERFFGGGLALKKIPVSGQFWDTQILDSSWVSALVQAGVLGALIALCWTVTTVVLAGTAPRPQRDLYLALLAFVVLRSILESGLFDTSAAFLIFLAIAMDSHLRRRVIGAAT